MEVKLNCLRSKMTQRQMICTKLGTEKKKVKNEIYLTFGSRKLFV